MFGFKKHRRKKLFETELRPDWKNIIERNVKFYGFLSKDQKKTLNGLIQVFMYEKIFEGCGGIEITDEMKLTISAQACLLILEMDTDIYPFLRTILVYPHAYKARFQRRLQDGSIVEGRQARLGESWSRGQVVLAWDEILNDISNINDGQNLVFHEFAHQLDEETGSANGIPVSTNHPLYSDWKRIISKEYENLLQAVTSGQETIIREYGATNKTEFFAVVTECYFEKPNELKDYSRELNELYYSFYQIDTAHAIKSI